MFLSTQKGKTSVEFPTVPFSLFTTLTMAPATHRPLGDYLPFLPSTMDDIRAGAFPNDEVPDLLLRSLVRILCVFIWPKP